MKRIRKFNNVQEMQSFAQADYFSFLGMVKQSGQASIMHIHKHIPAIPSNLVISCTSNIVTITADNATTIEYTTDGSSTYTTYTTPFAITETVTVYAKASNSDGSITASQECEYQGGYGTPFYIEDISGSSNTVQIKKNNASAPTITIEKSTDGETWQTMGTTSTTARTATVPANGKLYLRCSTNSWGTSSYYNNINTTGNCNVGGNIMSLLYGSNFTGNETAFPSGSTYNFDNLFYNNTHIINASDLLLPATTVTSYCYTAMFNRCSSLTTAPELPATTLANHCYYGMFYFCSSLTTAPELPAATLTQYCYNQMFHSCSNLNYIKCLATDISASYCTSNWVNGVASTGTFVKDPSMSTSTWGIGNNGIPTGWVVRNNSGISLSQDLNVVTIEVTGLDSGTGYYTINGGSQVSLSEGTTTIPITQAMNGQVLLVHGEFDGEPVQETMTLSWVDYSPTVSITESNNYVTIISAMADTIQYRLGSSGEYTTYTEPVYIASDTTIYVIATRTVSGVVYTTETSQEVTHTLTPPTNLVISCTDNFVTITATNATTIEYNTDGSSTYTTYTQPFNISQTVTVYARATNSDGSITASQECTYIDYAPPVSISESNNYVTITSTTADSITYRLGSSGEYSTYTTPVYIAADTTIYVIATRTVSGVTYTTETSQAVTHTLTPPTNLVISCSNNFVTITATGATTLEYNTDGSSTYITYTQPFAISQTVTVYARATNADGSISGSQECVYSGYGIPFYIEDISGSNNTVQITKTDSGAPTVTVEKSTDGVNWSTMGSTSTTAITATIPANGKLYLRSATSNWSYNTGAWNYINPTGRCNIGGNIMSLLYGSSFTGNETSFNGNQYVFYSLFRNRSNIINAEDLLLPATTLTFCCYQRMFNGCSALTTAPATLPATTLGQYCYQEMFSGCSALTTAPATLPATTLVNSCYSSMFSGCSALTTAPALPATTLAQNCYEYMFSGCTSLTTAPTLPATTLANYCYYYMFGSCTGLTTAPTLPATMLTNTCYSYMFSGCTHLNYIKCLATNITATNCTYYWVYNVSATGTFVKDPSMSTSTWGTGNNGIPTNWIVKNPSGIELTQALNVATIEVIDLDSGTGYYTINSGSQVSLSEGTTTIPITQAMNGQTLLAYGEFEGEPVEKTLTLSWVDYTPTITITETDNYVTISAPNADSITYRLGSSGEYSAYTAPVYIAADTTIYVIATRTVSGVVYTANASQAVTHSIIPPTNLVISCSSNTVTITADNATTIEYNTDGSSTYTTYTEPFAITETVTVYARATNADGSITASQECEYQGIPFESELIFYAPLTEGDLTEHISGVSLTNYGSNVTWDSTKGMYRFAAVTKANEMYFPVNLSTSITNNTYTILAEMQNPTYGSYNYPSIIVIGGYSDSTAVSDGSWRPSLANWRTINGRSNRMYLAIVINGKSCGSKYIYNGVVTTVENGTNTKCLISNWDNLMKSRVAINPSRKDGSTYNYQSYIKDVRIYNFNLTDAQLLEAING